MKAVRITLLLLLFGTGWPECFTSITGHFRTLAAAEPGQAAPGERLTSFVVMSDIHIQDFDAKSQQWFMKALQDYYSTKPDADMLVLNGDLTNGRKADFDTLRRLLDGTPHPPVQATMGNHDFYRMWLHGGRFDYTKLSPEWSSDKAIEQFNRFFGYAGMYRETVANGVPFLFLNGEAYRDVDDSYAEDAWLSDRQLEWLESRLAEHRVRRTAAKTPALVFLHQPLPGTVDGSGLERGVVRHERLRAILEKYPFAVLFSGHTHWDWETTNQLWRGPFTAVGSGSVRGAYSGDNRETVPAKSESLYVEVYPDRIVVHARDHTAGRWIGRPAVVSF